MQTGDLDDADEEPPCPPGLGSRAAPLEAFVEFMRIDHDLLEVAAAGSPEAGGTAPAVEVERWVSSLPEAEKTSLLVRLIEGDEPHLRAELIRRFRESRTPTPSRAAIKRRTVGELLKAAKQPSRYDAAVKLLKDLRDVALRAGRQEEIEARLVRLREQHARKPSFVARLQAAGLIGTTKEGRL
jgi:hypothetical protein